VRDESKNVELSTARRTHPALPIVVDRATWRANQDALLVREEAHLLREEAHLREGNAIAAAHRRLPIVQMDPAISVIGVSVRTTPGTPRDAAKWCA
jgi:hypothetical protein